MDSATLTRRLLDWFAARRRELPWRRDADPYRVWVSEIMLQQTRVEAVVPFYERWMARFPDVTALAAADEQEVLRRWAGLGYYRRARMLHAAAKEVVAAGGALPADRAGWRALPGVGEYTSAAIASIALGEPAAVVDGNVKRVAARFLALGLAADDRKLHQAAEAWGTALLAHAPSPGDLNQSLMELGATVCTPRAPRCGNCPIAAGCAAEEPLSHPLPPKKTPWKELQLDFLIAEKGGRYLLEQKRTGWTPGMWEPPGVRLGRMVSTTPLGSVRHTITHHKIEARAFRQLDWDGVGAVDPAAVPLSGLGRKLIALAERGR
ncbi:MAG: A/G-specific adenine glycosylase [Planctomycetes bacterium]|nr:A/G-specific adenine glycosylase [Planctomycetota bacterium]MBL7008158.1 A/G-specific adenine glycosylase [Planctomycetota bacterium]